MKKINNYSLYPSKSDGKIPAFNSYEEEANFWDTHNVTDFEDETEDVDIVFELNKPREEAVVLRVQKNLKLAIEKIARRNALNPSALMRMWLTEKVNEALSGKNKGSSVAT